MMIDDNDGQMIFGDLEVLKLPDICLTGEEKPRKNLTQETCPDRGSNPGSLRDRRACCRLAHSGGLHELNSWCGTNIFYNFKSSRVLDMQSAYILDLIMWYHIVG